MPNPNMLYAVTAIVVALLAVWIGLVFKNSKEPWAKAPLPVNESVPSKFSTIVDDAPSEQTAEGDKPAAAAAAAANAEADPSEKAEKPES